MQNLTDQYQQRQRRFTDEAATLRKFYDRVSLLRLLIFFASAALAIFLFSVHWAAASAFILLFVGGFYRMMVWHQQMLDRAKHLERLAAINGEEIKALDYDFGHYPDGSEYLQTDHPYALDLDIFGPFSFFQFCCRATTVIGQQRLADHLSHPAEIPEIQARQQAVSELSPQLDWRQDFQTLGSGIKDSPRHLDLLKNWLADEDVVRGNRKLVAALHIAPWWFLLVMVLWFFFIPWQIMILLLLPPAWVLKKTTERVNRTHLRTTYAGEMLGQYAQLLQHIESQDFSSEKLEALKRPLLPAGLPASAHIRRLAYIIRQLNVRYNFFAIFLNIITLWDLRWVYQLEKWKARLHDQLPVWFETLSEFEALASLANLHFNNPDWNFPELRESGSLEAVALGHPLISPKKRIANDMAMPTRGHLKLITGSNMAGKSTLLRTVGLNIVLAQAGAPVCAEKLTLPPLQVFTSMRTRDDLHESTSSFYAELKRLKVIIEAVDAAKNPQDSPLSVFFLLDEILKGTNSVDRHTGSAALIRQLIQLRGGGLIATHDLDLGRLEAEAGGAVENLCMEVEVKNGTLFFDYKIKKGVSQSFNATLLMQQMGIDV